MKLFRRNPDDRKLADSALYDERSFFGAFSKDFKAAKYEVIIESPYLTLRRTTDLEPLCAGLIRKGVRIHVYTRNPAHHDGYLKIQAIKSIQILKSIGVHVIQCNDMRHRKLAVIDDQILWEGSLNMLSHSNSREIMRRTNSRSMCQEMLRFTKLTSSIKC